jgi:hypothetical protein
MPVLSTENIVSKNLFDPERGAGRTREAEASGRALQRIRSMVLLGTAIIGSNRVAILQDSPDMRSGPIVPGTSAGVLRLKLGDDIEGFKLTEIGDRRVIFTKGTARVEVMLDYFRKAAPVEPTSPPAPGQVAPAKPAVPRVVPSLPQRDKLPAPPSP